MFRVRQLILVASFAAILLVYGGISSGLFRQVTRSVDVFFLTAVLFTISYAVVQRAGAATLLAAVAGLLFLLFVLAGVPAPFHIPASLIANGLVFDLYLGVITRGKLASRMHVLTAAGLGSLAMAVVGLLVLTASGIPTLLVIWIIAVVTDPMVGVAGSFFGLSIIKRIRPATVVVHQPPD